MATYMMKYNPGGTAPAGATQLKTLALATGVVDVSAGGWYGGVDDTNVYLITCDTTTLGLTGRPTGGGTTPVAPANIPTVWKTTDRTDASLVTLGNKLPGSPGNLTTASAVNIWLNANNFGLQPAYNTTTTTTAGNSSIRNFTGVTISGTFVVKVKIGAGSFNTIYSATTSIPPSGTFSYTQNSYPGANPTNGNTFKLEIFSQTGITTLNTLSMTQGSSSTPGNFTSSGTNTDAETFSSGSQYVLVYDIN
jgi:hypothetical protein